MYTITAMTRGTAYAQVFAELSSMMTTYLIVPAVVINTFLWHKPLPNRYSQNRH